MLRSQIQTLNVYKLRSYMIKETSTTPFAGISVIDNSFLIQGQIYLSLKMTDFRSRVLELLKDYYNNGNKLNKVRIDLELMQTGSVGWMYQVLALIWNSRHAEEDVEIIWYYDDSNIEILKEGQKISRQSGIPMTFISKN